MKQNSSRAKEKLLKQTCAYNISPHYLRVSDLILIILACVIIHEILTKLTSNSTGRNSSVEIKFHTNKTLVSSCCTLLTASRPTKCSTRKFTDIFKLDSPSHYPYGCFDFQQNHLNRQFPANLTLDTSDFNIIIKDIEQFKNICEMKQFFQSSSWRNLSINQIDSLKHALLTLLNTMLHINFSIIFNIFKTITYIYIQPLSYFIVPIILILLQSFWKTWFIHLISFNKKSSINHNHQKNRNINLLILLILLLFLLQLNFFNVSGDIFYVGTNGSDANSCTKDEPCLTLEQGTLRGSANDSTECIVFVMDKTTLSTEFIIYSILLPRTFTNNPENGTDQSEIQINIGGQFRITGNSLFERIKFTMQDGVSNENGGVIYTSFMSSPRTLEITNCSFVGCKATDSGSALCLYVINEVELTLRNLSFNHCETQTIGGALFAQIQSGGKLTISGSCLFTDCIASQTGSSGGAIRASIDGENSQLIFEDSMTFNGCSAFGGGGISLQITNKGHLMMTGSWLFTNCNSTQHDGGGCKISVYGPNFYIQLLGNMYFEDCESGQNGGGLNFYSESTGQVTINEMSFSKCNSAFNGGGFCSRFESGALMTITGRITFEKCNSSGDNYGGGGQYIIANGSGCVVNITGKLEYKQCQANLGGGLFADIRDNAILEINKASFQNCISNSHGGGIFSNISSGGQLILNKSCEFYQCQSNGNGGGIYIMIDISTQCAFVIKDTFIHECKALNSTNSSLTLSQSGFGGCLFLAGNGDYDPSTELIDLRGMKIYNNQAYRYGQSIYIVTTKIVEFCKYGILGEYVKGNYSDTYSNEQELVGISMDLITFNISTSEEIRQLQQTLEPLWRILGILNGAQVTVNVSNPNGKLVFILEGQRMVPKYLNMKIFELRDKTQEEMDLEQQEMNFYYNKNNFKSLRRTQQSQITLKHQKADQQQISINSNIKIKKNLHNYANEIIYPPEDGSSIPIQIDGELESEQKATFGMNDYQWLNYKEKIYAVLISNDRNIFSGKDGVTVEEDLNAAVQLEVIIEEEDGKEKGLPIGIIVGIAVGALAIVAVIIIIIIVAVFISKKKKAKNAKKPASSYDPEMRARNLPMENQFPQNSHSLDAVNKAMESNNW